MLITPIELFKKSLILYKRHFGRYTSYSIILLILIALLQMSGKTLPMLILFTKSLPLGIMIFITFAILFSFIQIAIILSFIRTIASDYMNKQIISIIPSIKQVYSIILPTFLILIMIFLIILSGLLFFFIPGIVFIIWFIFSIHALAIDNKRSFNAIKYSKELISDRWFSVILRLIVSIFMIWIIISSFQWLYASILNIHNNAIFQFKISQIIYLILNSIINIFVISLAMIIPTILYIELKKTHITQNSDTQIS